MAERRMFSKTVTESDSFYDMPASSRALYLHLGMNADDDGVVDSPKRIMRASAATEDDLRVLISKQFVIPFDSGVIVVRHWKRNNYIQKDRYRPTVHQAEIALLEASESGEYALQGEARALPVRPACIQDVSETDTQVRLGKDSLGEDRNPLSGKPNRAAIVREVVDYLNAKTGRSFKAASKSTARHIKARAAEGFALDDFKAVIDAKAAQWGSDPNMSRYLRPETLFGSKFEGYLNEGTVKRNDYSEYDC